MDGARQASRRAVLKAAGASVGAAGLAIAATPLATVAGTDDTNQIDEGAVNISEATTVMKSSSTVGAAFVGQSVSGRPGLFGHTAESDGGTPNSNADFSGVVGVGVGTGARGITAREGSGAEAALVVQGRARFSRSGRANVNAGKASRTVALPKVTPQSLVFAVLAKNVAGRYVRAVVPGDGSFTVFLNKSVSALTPFTWIVFDPNLD